MQFSFDKCIHRFNYLSQDTDQLQYPQKLPHFPLQSASPNPGNNWPAFCHYRCLYFLEFHTKGIIWYILLCVGFFNWTQCFEMSPRSCYISSLIILYHLVSTVQNTHLVLSIPVLMDIWIIFSFELWWLSCYVHTETHMWMFMFSFSAKYLWEWLVGHNVIVHFNFWGCQVLFLSGRMNLHSHQQWVRSLAILHSHWYIVLSVLNLSYLMFTGMFLVKHQTHSSFLQPSFMSRFLWFLPNFPPCFRSSSPYMNNLAVS